MSGFPIFNHSYHLKSNSTVVLKPTVRISKYMFDFNSTNAILKTKTKQLIVPKNKIFKRQRNKPNFFICHGLGWISIFSRRREI